MDQTEQIINALREAGTKAGEILADSLPMLVAEARAVGLAHVIAGGIVAVLGLVLCFALTRRLPAMLKGPNTDCTDGAMSLTSLGALASAVLAIAGVIVALNHIKPMMAPMLYLVEQLL